MHYKICKKNNNRLVTNQILENAGFENITQIFEKRYYKEGYDIDDYASYIFFTDKIDKVLTHNIWGVPIFLAIMALVFVLTFTLGDYFSSYLQPPPAPEKL